MTAPGRNDDIRNSIPVPQVDAANLIAYVVAAAHVGLTAAQFSADTTSRIIAMYEAAADTTSRIIAMYEAAVEYASCAATIEPEFEDRLYRAGFNFEDRLYRAGFNDDEISSIAGVFDRASLYAVRRVLRESRED